MGRGPTQSIRVAIFALALLVTLAVGCGDDNSGGEPPGGRGARVERFGTEASGRQARRIESNLRNYVDARSTGAWKRACSYLTTQSRDLLSRFSSRSSRAASGGCVAGLASVTGQLSAPERAELAVAGVVSVRVDGVDGYAIYETPRGGRYAMAVQREAGRWAVDGSALPLD